MSAESPDKAREPISVTFIVPHPSEWELPNIVEDPLGRCAERVKFTIGEDGMEVTRDGK